jgi:ankyrin repeat protein
MAAAKPKALDRLAASLRAAAAAGRTADLETLLAQGAPVDAQDADGDTALIKAVRGGHVAAVAVLRRHGASVDVVNHAGESARGMAEAMGDEALSRALGVDSH